MDFRPVDDTICRNIVQIILPIIVVDMHCHDIRHGGIDLIITKSVSRFARNTVDSLVTIRKLKENGVECYFEKEGIDLVVDGDFVRAEGTTLGGDDGIAVAMMLAILDDETIVHPRLECVFTTEEETGLYGAEALDCSRLTGRRMINIDSRREGVFTVSCAGGVGCGCMLPLTWEEIEENSCTLWVEGLKGGHSGSDIHRELGNSNMLMGRLLYSLTRRICSTPPSTRPVIRPFAAPDRPLKTRHTTTPDTYQPIQNQHNEQP